ncbi:Hypothetical predicted protein [Cloeon dipterum]|uniref:Major facilitator superfamily (MFS) profile domain-containing protein n=2 Tax=Cloeon dipterum TaxID=197152 RepID=A0A8S1DG88_9INSE|nr:Hypothetical predicted protein [Cloeon dipterum]
MSRTNIYWLHYSFCNALTIKLIVADRLICLFVWYCNVREVLRLFYFRAWECRCQPRCIINLQLLNISLGQCFLVTFEYYLIFSQLISFELSFRMHFGRLSDGPIGPQANTPNAVRSHFHRLDSDSPILKRVNPLRWPPANRPRRRNGRLHDSSLYKRNHHANSAKLLGLDAQPCIFDGMLVVYVMGASHLQWNVVAATCASVPLLHFLVMHFLPESPVWLRAQSKHTQADKAMRWLNKRSDDSNCIRTQDTTDTSSAWESLVSKHSRRPLLVMLVFFFFQQFCGMNAVIFYAVQIFQSADSGVLSSNQSAVVIGVARLIVICLSCVILSKIGRRPVSIISGVGMSVSMITLGTIMQLQETPSLAASLTCMTGFIAFNTFGKSRFFLNF